MRFCLSLQLGLPFSPALSKRVSPVSLLASWCLESLARVDVVKVGLLFLAILLITSTVHSLVRAEGWSGYSEGGSSFPCLTVLLLITRTVCSLVPAEGYRAWSAQEEGGGGGGVLVQHLSCQSSSHCHVCVWLWSLCKLTELHGCVTHWLNSEIYVYSMGVAGLLTLS